MRARRHGMSLIEVMVTVAIILVMSTITFSVLQSSLDTRDVLAETDDVTRGARVTMSKLRRELQHAFLSKYPQAINTYETVFVGTDSNPDTLYFASSSHQRLYRDSRQSDQTEITLWAESVARGEGYVLYHRESGRIDEEPAEGGTIYPLAYNVRTFNVRYLDSRTNEWTDEWDTRSVDQANRLPRAVQIGLVLVSEEDDGGRKRTVDHPFVTTILIEQGEALQKSPFNPEQLPDGGAVSPDSPLGGPGGGNIPVGPGGGSRPVGAPPRIPRGGSQ